MVQIVIAALAKGMAIDNLTLEESLTLLDAKLMEDDKHLLHTATTV